MTISPSQPIRVMIVDDHTMVRRGLATFLKVFDDLKLAGEADNGEAAVQLCAEVMPDVILMDMVMPKMDGVEFLANFSCCQECADKAVERGYAVWAMKSYPRDLR